MDLPRDYSWNAFWKTNISSYQKAKNRPIHKKKKQNDEGHPDPIIRANKSSNRKRKAQTFRSADISSAPPPPPGRTYAEHLTTCTDRNLHPTYTYQGPPRKQKTWTYSKESKQNKKATAWWTPESISALPTVPERVQNNTEATAQEDMQMSPSEWLSKPKLPCNISTPPIAPILGGIGELSDTETPPSSPRTLSPRGIAARQTLLECIATCEPHTADIMRKLNWELLGLSPCPTPEHTEFPPEELPRTHDLFLKGYTIVISDDTSENTDAHKGSHLLHSPVADYPEDFLSGFFSLSEG